MIHTKARAIVAGFLLVGTGIFAAGPAAAAPSPATVAPAISDVPMGHRAYTDVDGEVHVVPLNDLTSLATNRTPAAKSDEETYDLTLTFLDREGNPSPAYSFRLFDTVNPQAYEAYDESGTVTVRVPKGEYYLDGMVQTPAGTGFWPMVEFAEPALVVDGPATLVFDSRDGVPVGFTVDQPNADEGDAVTSSARTTAWGQPSSTTHYPNLNQVWVLPSRTSAPEAFSYTVGAVMSAP